MGRDDGMFTNYATADMAAARAREARIPTPSDMQRDVVRGILQRGMDLLDVKGHDYAGDDSAFINFTLTGLVLSHAVRRGLQQEDLAFVSFIATKLARLIELRGSGKTPKNETIEDTCMDLANYAALWGGWILTRKKEQEKWTARGRRIGKSDETIDYAEMADAMEREEAAEQIKTQHRMIVALKKDVSTLLQTKGCEATLSEFASQEYPDLDLEAAKEAREYRDESAYESYIRVRYSPEQLKEMGIYD